MKVVDIENCQPAPHIPYSNDDLIEAERHWGQLLQPNRTVGCSGDNDVALARSALQVAIENFGIPWTLGVENGKDYGRSAASIFLRNAVANQSGRASSPTTVCLGIHNRS